MMRETKMVELAQHEDTSDEGTEDENLILLLLSPDLRNRYMKILVNRLIKADVVVLLKKPVILKKKKINMTGF